MKLGLSVLGGLSLLAAVTGERPAYAQGVWEELKKWDDAAPSREAERKLAQVRERKARIPCKGEETLCETQLIERGWHVVSAGYEPLGIDIGLSFKLLQLQDQQKICTTFISYDGTGQERPCHPMQAQMDLVKN